MKELPGRRWAVITSVAGTVFIAAGAFWLSFTSLADLARRSGIGAGQAWAWPLIVDGVIVVSTVAVVALAGERAAWYPWELLIGGAAVSVTANSLHAVVAADADVPGPLAAAVAAVPPVVLLAITHLTVVLTRATARPTPAIELPPAREVLCETATVSNCSIGTTSCFPRGPTRVTECWPSQDRISTTASRCAASSASDTSGCRAAATERDLGTFTTISMNRGDPRPPSPRSRGRPIDSPVSGLIQSTHWRYSSAVSPSSPITRPSASTAVNSARAVPASR